MGRVLVIESDADVRTLLLLLLQRAGYAACGAPDGARGLDLALELAPDVIIVELDAPAVSGWAVTRRLRGHYRMRSVGVIGLTTRPIEAVRLQAALAGFDDVLCKPFELDSLLRAVARLRRRGEPSGPDPNAVTC